MAKSTATPAKGQLALKWSDFLATLAQPLRDFLNSGDLSDVTLASDDGFSVKAHKIILASRSSYFHQLFKNHPCKNPIVILRDVNQSNLKAILEFMYKGEINLPEQNIPELLKVADLLKVKGLDEFVSRNAGSNSRPQTEKKTRKKRKRKLQSNSLESTENHQTSESDNESHQHEPKKRQSSQQQELARSSSPSPSAKKNSSQNFSENFSNAPDSPKLYEERDNSAIEQIEPSRILEQSMATAEVTGQDNGDELISFGSPNGKGFGEEEGMGNSLFDENPLISVTESNTSDAMLLTAASTSAPQAATICVVYGQGTNSPGDQAGLSRSLKESRYECDVCRLKFASNYNLKRHLSTHDSDRPRWQCSHCEKSFTRRDSLPKHMAFAHKELAGNWTKENLALSEEN